MMIVASAAYWTWAATRLSDPPQGVSRFFRLPDPVAEGRFREGWYEIPGVDGLIAVFVPDWAPPDTHHVLGTLGFLRLCRARLKVEVDEYLMQPLAF